MNGCGKRGAKIIKKLFKTPVGLEILRFFGGGAIGVLGHFGEISDDTT